MKPTQEQVIAWARNAGLEPHRIHGGLVVTHSNGSWVNIEGIVGQICAAVYEAGRKDENEACAKVLDEMAAKDRLSNYYKVAAIAIRARREQ